MPIEWWHFWIGIATLIGTGFGVAARLGYVTATLVSTIKAEFNARMELAEAEHGKAVGKVYERFDEYKKTLEGSFVRRESCQLSHNNTSQSIMELKASVEKLSDKVDALLMRGK